jgi:hypothetical protein
MAGAVVVGLKNAIRETEEKSGRVFQVIGMHRRKRVLKEENDWIDRFVSERFARHLNMH